MAPAQCKARASSLETMAPQEPIEVHPIDPRGPRRRSDVAVFAGEDPGEISALESAHESLALEANRAAQIGSHRVGGRRRLHSLRGSGFALAERCALVQRQTALQIIAKLTHVAGPFVP